ncbi:MAG: hypothetical protein JOY90_19050 [Bradyrhizobium sp.]|uniref:hypothetical protein n=1 Tax=Bradyrhizobium sp. TaxID=376 RepID=UPI001E12D17A|nr:hypothetical protein [Bradyrhizobium sp.]MBV9562516.1 hypothetical protein [Bradyrhizobium sp.]
MADKGNDPLAMWQRMVSDMQKSFSALASQAIQSSRLGGPTTAAGEASSGSRQLDSLMERYLVSMNLPSRGQMADLADRLQAIEGQLNEIKALLLQMRASEAPPPAPKPPRGRRPPGAPKSSTEET